MIDPVCRKDTRGVFAEPVDPEEVGSLLMNEIEIWSLYCVFRLKVFTFVQLPDYHEVIEHPMDFGTVRKKLDGGLYTTLEQLEVSGFLSGVVVMALEF